MGLIKLRLPDLQNNNVKDQKISLKSLKKRYEDVEIILYHQGLSYVLKIIWFKLISYYHNNLIVSHCKIEKIRELVVRKYF